MNAKQWYQRSTWGCFSILNLQPCVAAAKRRKNLTCNRDFSNNKQNDSSSVRPEFKASDSKPGLFVQIQNNMEAMVKKYQQKFKKVREEMDRWDQLQSRLLSQFRNASSIIWRLQELQDSKNYIGLKSVEGIEEAVLRNQMESLENILLSMRKTTEEFSGLVSSLDKIHRDGKMLIKGSSVKTTVKQLQQRIGVKPSLADCLDSLMILHEMHNSEYLLKSSIVTALPTLALKPSVSDLGTLQQLLVDQPNIPKEVQFIFDIIFAEEIC